MDGLRRRLFRSIPDLAASTFLGLIIPVTYWFEMFVVLPSVPFLRPPLLYYGHLVLGTYLLASIVGNWVMVMLTNTSTERVVVPVPRRPSDVDMTSRDKWRFCPVCESFQPPRTWHCGTCNKCILKRDHHCLFTGCCVGHRNQRYFLLLVAYLFVATTYVTVYNNYFIWILHAEKFRNSVSLLKIIFPLAAMVNWSLDQFYFLVYMVNLVGSLFTGALLFYHARNALSGDLAYEANCRSGGGGSKKDADATKVDYNLGWAQNLRMIFGRSWAKALVNPFAISELPHDGIHWETVARHKAH